MDEYRADIEMLGAGKADEKTVDRGEHEHKILEGNMFFFFDVQAVRTVKRRSSNQVMEWRLCSLFVFSMNYIRKRREKKCL